jgi:hypothetical protein
MKIVVHIDSILLDGLSAKLDPRRLSATIESELCRFLKAAPLEHWRNGAIDDVAAPIPPIVATRQPEAIGRGIARVTGSVITSSQTTQVEHAFGNTTGDRA